VTGGDTSGPAGDRHGRYVSADGVRDPVVPSFSLPALGVAVVLLAIYIATLAPDVTFWDSGEFIAAARVLGIPHPPGTPLYIVLLHAWAQVFSFLPFAVATNLFSAVCTAGAGALSALVVARSTGDRWAGVAAGIIAGSMTSVWQNATETEVYAASLALAIAAIAAADVAGRRRDRRWAVLAAYLLALAAPLHLSALVATPVVVYLAARPVEGPVDWSTGAAIAGVAITTVGVARWSPAFTTVGLALVVGAPVVSGFVRAPMPVRDREARGRAFVMASIVALSALAFLYVRAQHDPAINQGNPSTLDQLAYVVSRRQYDVAPLWPRQAPMWIQVGNWFEYADWQFALSLAPTVMPTVARVAVTAVFAAIAVVGAVAQMRTDRRGFTAGALLFASGSLGVIAYLNLKPGASFGWGVLPSSTPHEARDRDYFFVLGFWAWGLWAGIGAAAISRRFAGRSWVGLVAAVVPVALNWTAVTRRHEPEASMPRHLATALLEPLPPRSVLFVSGDNDSYPLWYAQQVLGLRTDVVVVTTPLLGAPWYEAELERRYKLGGPRVSPARGPMERIARAARAQGRPVAAALSLAADDRNRLNGVWKVIGAVAIDIGSAGLRDTLSVASSTVPAIDSAATAQWAQRIAEWQAGRSLRPALDPVHEYYGRLLDCPRMALTAGQSPSARASLDSLCNFR